MFVDLVKKNRSYRGFDPNEHISIEQLKALISHARLCSCAVNRQSIRYILSADKERNDMIFKHTNWAMALDIKVPFEGQEPTGYIVMCIDSELQQNKISGDINIGIAAQTILLAAVEMGFGGCIIGSFNSKNLEGELGIPQRYMSRLIIALGKPVETVVITDCTDANTGYYRDANNVHYVPKLTTENLIIDI